MTPDGEAGGRIEGDGPQRQDIGAGTYQMLLYFPITAKLQASLLLILNLGYQDILLSDS